MQNCTVKKQMWSDFYTVPFFKCFGLSMRIKTWNKQQNKSFKLYGLLSIFLSGHLGLPAGNYLHVARCHIMEYQS